MTMPSQALLSAAIGQQCQLFFISGGSTDAELIGVHAGVPMSARYCCYTARFALPAGVKLQQQTCAVQLGAQTWPLLLTPTGLTDDGRLVLQAVFHYPIPQASAPVEA